jgi:hypothetical protein
MLGRWSGQETAEGEDQVTRRFWQNADPVQAATAIGAAIKTARSLRLMLAFIVAGPLAVMQTAVAEPAITVGLGRILDEGGNPVANATVAVSLWRDTEVSVGEPVDIVVLAEGTTDESGRFELTITDPGLIAEFFKAVAANGGFANLELSAHADSFSYTTFYSLGPGDVGQATATALPSTLVTGMSRSPLRGRTIELAPGAPGVSRVQPIRPGGPRPPCLAWVKTGDLSSAWGTIGEIHRWGEWIPRDTFIYGATADSEFEIAFYNGSSWRIQGSAHVGNSNTTSGSTAVTPSHSSTGYKVEGLFKRASFSQVCTSNQKRQATQWDGVNVRLGPAISGLDGQCDTYPTSYRNTFSSSQIGWTRNSNQAFKWGAAISMVVLTVGGRSGYSTSAQSSWTFKSGQNKTLCGNDAYITSSHRVFAGL